MPDLLNPVHAERAAELAQASQEARELFYLLMVGFLIIFAFWSLIRWRMNRERYQRNRAAALHAEVARNEKAAAEYWEEFCKRNELPESTRNVLCPKKERVS